MSDVAFRQYVRRTLHTVGVKDGESVERAARLIAAKYAQQILQKQPKPTSHPGPHTHGAHPNHQA